MFRRSLLVNKVLISGSGVLALALLLLGLSGTGISSAKTLRPARHTIQRSHTVTKQNKLGNVRFGVPYQIQVPGGVVWSDGVYTCYSCGESMDTSTESMTPSYCGNCGAPIWNNTSGSSNISGNSGGVDGGGGADGNGVDGGLR